MPKRLGLFLCFSLSLGVASAQTVELSMAYAGGDPLFKELIHETVSAFTAVNPRVVIREYPSVAGGSYLEFIGVLAAAGQFPDVCEMRDTPVFFREGWLAPLPEEVARLVVNPIRFEGKVYTASLVAQAPLGMIYNAKYFRENGLAEPKTYAEFLGLLGQIKARKATPIVVGGKDLWHLTFLFSKYYLDEVTSKTPDFIAKRYAGKVKFADASMKRALSEWAELFSASHGWVDPDFPNVADSETVSALVGGRGVMLFSGTWMLQQIADAAPGFEIGWFPVPSSSDDRINLIGGSTAQGWAMSAKAAEDPAKRKAITDFIRFFFRKDNYEHFIGKMNAFPTTIEKIDYRSAIPVMDKILDIYAATDGKQLIWNQQIGENELPPGFRDFAYLQFMKLLLGVEDVDSTVEALDRQWDIVTKSFNPVRTR